MKPNRRAASLALPLLLTACAGTIGVRQTGPDSFVVSEMRAPVLGGGPEAKRAALAEAYGFCQSLGLVLMLTTAYPGGPYSAYGPVEYTAYFRCVPPPAAVTRKPG